MGSFLSTAQPPPPPSIFLGEITKILENGSIKNEIFFLNRKWTSIGSFSLFERNILHTFWLWLSSNWLFFRESQNTKLSISYWRMRDFIMRKVWTKFISGSQTVNLEIQKLWRFLVSLWSLVMIIHSTALITTMVDLKLWFQSDLLNKRSSDLFFNIFNRFRENWT